MSYCRFGEADVYVFASGRGFECCGCPTQTFYTTESAPHMIKHMLDHRAAGLDVPDDAIYGIWYDRHLYTGGPQ